MKFRFGYRLLCAVLAWSALAIQLYLLMGYAIARQLPAITGVMKFFDYFTILTNILVATVFTAMCFKPQTGWVRFFSHPRVKTGVAVYIFITGLVYVTLLRNLWNPQGLQLLADVLLHYATPVLFGIEWLFLTPKGVVWWSDVLRWLMFPLFFGVWSLGWGGVFGFYPYPFIDVANLGYPQVFLNIVAMTGGFLLMGALLVLIDRALDRVLTSKQSI